MPDTYFHGPALDESVSSVTATPSVQLGTRYFFQSSEYVYAFNAGAATATVKAGCKFVTAASGYSVTVVGSTNVYNPLVGVVKHTEIPASSYGWLLTRGFASVEMVTAMTGDYKMIALGLNGRFIEASGTTTMGTATVVGHLGSHNVSAGSAAYAYIRAGV